ncbi:MAG: hypothetical protein MUP97_02400 [Acidimicrobiia bacterium]|nr:hypothetical protein [Acidimicrobiia bacterium]
MIRPGATWGVAASGAEAFEGRGSDVELAELARSHPGELVRFVPTTSCDLARAVGLTAESSASWELPIDAIDLGDGFAVNMVVLGTRPDRVRWWTRSRSLTVHVDDRLVFDGRAASVLVANGQYLAGRDVVPRGHPGDGRLEMQVYAVRVADRASMRRRLPAGTHVPHPDITCVTGRRFRVRVAAPLRGEVDGVGVPARRLWEIEVVPGALRLLV